MIYIKDFEISKIPIETQYNECIFCFEDINSYSELFDFNDSMIKNINITEIEKICSVKKGIILLECGHNYHTDCFLTYIMHKLSYKEFVNFLSCSDFKCPLCMRKMHYLTICKILKEYKTMLLNDKKIITKKIIQLSLTVRYNRLTFWVNNMINREIYISDIYKYYKRHTLISHLKTLKNDISKKLQNMNYIKICT